MVILGYLEIAIAATCLVLRVQASYRVVHDYSGATFFDGWDFYGDIDNLTWGYVNYLNREDAFAQRLAYTNDRGNAVIRVDNFTTVALPDRRNSIRLESKDLYDVGSMWLFDATHIPYGCSTWPAFWTHGSEVTWPASGEIDIVEAINVMGNNQMAIHTTGGCFKAVVPTDTGYTIGNDCSIPAGCVVAETKPNSWSGGFAQAGGGVFATQFDATGVYMWFWSRPDVPQSIRQSNSTSLLDLYDWGPPSASFPNTACNISQYFTTQQLTLDITLCGVWAGVPEIYGPSCGNSGPTKNCASTLDNVIGPGSPKYDTAYFEIPFIRAYTIVIPDQMPTNTGTTSVPSQALTITDYSITTTPTPTTRTSTSAAGKRWNPSSWNAFMILTILCALNTYCC